MLASHSSLYLMQAYATISCELINILDPMATIFIYIFSTRPCRHMSCLIN